MSLVFRGLRIRAERARHLNAFRRVVIGELCRDDRAGRDIFLDPFFQGKLDVVAGVIESRELQRAWLAEAVWTGAESTVLHAGHHVETNERVDLLLTHRSDYSVIVVD